jgi:peptidoglycan/LPS O-acetylase OafA/YrhL
VFNLWFAWCCGAFLADKKLVLGDDLKKPVYLLFYLAILIGFVYLNYFPNSFSIVQDQFNILIWTAPMVFILSCENWLRKKEDWWIIKILATIGLSSYSLYLLHEPLLMFKNWAVDKLLPEKLHLAGVLIGIFFIPIVAWFSYQYIEKPFTSKKRTIGRLS